MMMRIVQAGALAFLFLSTGVAAAQTTTTPTTTDTTTTTTLDHGDIKHAARLQAEVNEIDAEAAKLSPAGQQKVTDAIAKRFKVDATVVTDLRAKNLGFGEIAGTLALSQELMKRDPSLTQQQALDTILARRANGEGFGSIAASLGLKLGHARSEVAHVEKSIEKLEKAEKKAAERAEKDALKAEKKAEKLERHGKIDKPEKIEKIEKAEKMEKPEKPIKVERSGR
jgi:hypothetical protein